MLIRGIISVAVFCCIFDIILSQLTKSKPEFFSPLYKVTNKWRGKRLYKWIAFIIVLIPWVIKSVYFDLNHIMDGIIVGFILTLCDIAFRDSCDIFGPND